MTQDYLKDKVLYNIIRIISQIVLLSLILFLIFIVGLFIGYSIIGNGKFWEVLNIDTWRHILNFIK